jgi:hypothetical protein
MSLVFLHLTPEETQGSNQNQGFQDLNISMVSGLQFAAGLPWPHFSTIHAKVETGNSI